MFYWLMAGVLALGAALVLARAGRVGHGGASSADAALNIYRDQLASLDREVETGVLTPAEAGAQRTEIQRRMLEAAREKTSLSDAPARPMPWVAALIVPVAAGLLYWQIGSPRMADVPRAERMANAIASGDTIAMVAQVEEHLEKRPDDVQGWDILLAQYTGAGRYTDAARALQNIMRLTQPTSAHYADLAELLTFANEGLMTAEAVAAAREALSRDPQNPKAMYYAAVALKEEGKRPEALNLFRAMVTAAPADAPWLEPVKKQIASLEAAPAGAVPSSSAPVIGQDQVEQGMNLAPEQRTEMIRGMVEGLEQKLAANANDLEGWLRLIRARAVLGEQDRAAASLAKARGLFATDAQATAALADLAKQMGLP